MNEVTQCTYMYNMPASEYGVRMLYHRGIFKCEDNSMPCLSSLPDTVAWGPCWLVSCVVQPRPFTIVSCPWHIPAPKGRGHVYQLSDDG